MSEENKINQSISSPIVEDVFSKVDESINISASQEPINENVDILESSIGQEEAAPLVQKEGVVDDFVAHQDTKEKSKSFNTNKILFYFILSLIILLGIFAIWALIF